MKLNDKTNVKYGGRLRWEATIVGLVALAATLAASERLPLSWDEGDAFNRAERVILWSGALWRGSVRDESLNLKQNSEKGENKEDEKRQNKHDVAKDDEFVDFGNFNGRTSLFSERGIAAGWPHTVYREGHPAGASIAIALGKYVATRLFPFLSEKTAFRFGPIFLFALALAAIFYRTSVLFGRFAGGAAAVAILTTPSVFGLAQFAGSDSLLISSWAIAWATFDAALRSKWGAIFWGVAVGGAFCAKFSGFAVAIPFAFYVAFSFVADRTAKKLANGDESAARVGRVAFGFGVAAAFFFATNPPLWARPIAGFETFFALNWRRDGFDIPVFFLGKLYSPTRPLPIWNGFFGLGTTIPLATLVFAFVGVGRTVALSWNRVATRRAEFGGRSDLEDVKKPDIFNEKNKFVAKDKFERACFAALATALGLGLILPIVRGFPGTPTHDGVRLSIASFPFWGVLAGVGAAFCVDKIRRFCGKKGARVAVAATLAVGGFVDLFGSAPQYLSFYNALLGGVVGATRLGMEPTYYWDAFDAAVVDRLNAEIVVARDEGRPSGVLFGTFSSQSLAYYRRWGTLATSETATISAPNAFEGRERFGFYVLQRRPSGLTALDLALMKGTRPIFRKTKRNSWGGKNRVVLLEVYDFRDVERILGELARKKTV